MKKILYFIALLLSFSITLNCSSDRDESITNQGPGNIVKIPDELIGSWKINHIALVDDPDFMGGNDLGAYIKIKTDNIVEYYDGNNKYDKLFIFPVEKVSGNTLANDNIVALYDYHSLQSIQCRKSNKYPGQIEFKILYASGSPYKSMILIGTKQ